MGFLRFDTIVVIAPYPEAMSSENKQFIADYQHPSYDVLNVDNFIERDK